MRIFLSLVLTVCLIFGAVSLGTAGDENLYDPMYVSTYGETYAPVYGASYPATPDTDWVPGYEASVTEEAVAAGRLMGGPGLLIIGAPITK